MSLGVERQVIGRLLVLQVFPQALPELEGRHLQTPFGRAALVALQGAWLVLCQSMMQLLGLLWDLS